LFIVIKNKSFVEHLLSLLYVSDNQEFRTSLQKRVDPFPNPETGQPDSESGQIRKRVRTYKNSRTSQY